MVVATGRAEATLNLALLVCEARGIISVSLPKTMPKGKGRNQNSNKGGGNMINVTAGRFRMEMPMPRLPRWLGTPSLSANNVIYPRVNLDMPTTLQVLGLAAGSLASSTNIDSSLIPNFATRFGATFKEFAIVGCRFELRLTSTSTPQGFILGYIDEFSNAAPTSTSLNYAHVEVPLVGTSVDSTGSIHKIEWVARSYADLTWDAIGTSGVVAYLKLFASSATGTNASTTATLLVSGAVSICFRGYI